VPQLTSVADVISRFSTSAILDIVVVTIVFYLLLTFGEGTRAVQLFRGILILLAIAAVLGVIFRLSTFGWLIQTSFPALLLSIPVVFQPELRRALERIGRTGDWLGSLGVAHVGLATAREIAGACARLVAQRQGALIIVERETGLQDFADKGVALDAVVSIPLLCNLFFPNSPLHDGAVIIRQGRVVAAGCALPLSENVDGSLTQGMRHRAALGVSESSDALAIVVSEQTGKVSIATDGKLTGDVTIEELERTLDMLMKTRSGWSRR
jgi:diadenylate cyclase